MECDPGGREHPDSSRRNELPEHRFEVLKSGSGNNDGVAVSVYCLCNAKKPAADIFLESELDRFSLDLDGRCFESCGRRGTVTALLNRPFVPEPTTRILEYHTCPS